MLAKHLVVLLLLANPVVAIHAALPVDPAAQHPGATLLTGLVRAEGLDVPAPQLAPFLGRDLRVEVLTYYALSGAQLTPRGLAKLDASLAELPDGLAAPTATLLATMNEAKIVRNFVFRDLSSEDVLWARDASLSADTLDASDLARLAQIGGRIDVARMATVGALVLAATERATAEYRAVVAADPAAIEELFFTDPFGAIVLAGSQDDVHDVDRFLAIDLGGNDLWSNNAGATKPDYFIEAFPGCISTLALDCTALYPSRNGPAMRDLMGRTCSWNLVEPTFLAANHATATADALGSGDPQALLDAAEGADEATMAAIAASAINTYCLPQGADDAEAWSEDFTERGTISNGDDHNVAVALDLSGDDIYSPPKEFNDMNNGTGNAAGCDTRDMGEAGKIIARNVTAGSSFAGVGILLDGAGSDYYEGRSITQAVAHVGAVAALVDEGDGDDHYVGVRFSQGTAFFAAVSLLDERGGNDLYEQKNEAPFFNEFEAFIGCDVSTRDGQGRANFNAIGALVDHAGDDVYFTQDHIAEGKFLPGASRDDPTTTQGSTGTRLTIGPSDLHPFQALGRGILWDRAGVDVYSRPGRADACFDNAGTFLDQQATVPATRPCG